MLLAAGGWACGGESLDNAGRTSVAMEGSTGDTLPSLDSGTQGPTSGLDGGDDGGPAGMCAPGCSLALPVDWSFEGIAWPIADEPVEHGVPAMLRGEDGSLVVAEQRGGWVNLYSLDATGQLQWLEPLPLPCDRCELGGMSLHPSGDLLFGAVGDAWDGGFSRLAGRWDPYTGELVWSAVSPALDLEELTTYSGEIVSITDSLVAHLYVFPLVEARVYRATGVAVYGAGGTLLGDVRLSAEALAAGRPPVLARRTPFGEVQIAIPRGIANNPYSSVGSLQPLDWDLTDIFSHVELLDDMIIDTRDHALELGHSFDGATMRFSLRDRLRTESDPRWVATLPVPSTTDSNASLATDSEGDLYVAAKTTQAVGGDEAVPAVALSGLTLMRWSSDGVLRWQNTLLMDLSESRDAVALAVDDARGLVLAEIVEGHLRVERREQTCRCE